MEDKKLFNLRVKDTSRITTFTEVELYESPKVTSYSDDEILSQLGPAQTGEGSFGGSLGAGIH